jgi:flagellar protein FliO/FliZ
MGTAVPASPLSIGSLAQLTLSLLLIVGLILAISWAMKRFRLAGPRGRGDITVLDQLALGPRERIVLVGVGAAQVLIGIGASGMVALTPLEKPIDLNPAPAVPAFADRLRELMRRPGNSA